MITRHVVRLPTSAIHVGTCLCGAVRVFAAIGPSGARLMRMTASRESIPLRDLVAAHALRERLVSCATALDGDGLRDVKHAVGRAAKSLEKLALLVAEVVDVEALPRVSGVPVSPTR